MQLSCCGVLTRKRLHMFNSAPRALVADDEGLVSSLIEDILIDRGYCVTVVNTRQQLEEALTQRWDLAVADTDLASATDMASWNVQRVVLCTGQPADAVAEEFPGIPFIAKPCNADDFEAVLGDQNVRREPQTPSPSPSP